MTTIETIIAIVLIYGILAAIPRVTEKLKAPEQRAGTGDPD